MAIKHTNEAFIAKAIEVHNDLYSYELVDYKNNYTKVKIMCKQHGEFLQRPNNHLNGKGCPSCGSISSNKERTTRVAVFITKANIIHDSKYSYELVDYKNAHTKVKITCKSHGVYEQVPNSHLQGRGCPACALSEQGWTRTSFKEKCTKNNESKGILYILECFNDTERFIKIGITSRSVKRRYPSKESMPYEYTILYELEADPEVIYDLETLLHKKSKNYKYTPITPFGGSLTECFEADLTYLGKLNTYINKLNNIQVRR